ncbi:MAG: Gx transporter family protein [Bacilli bacterium]|nr:Gx transporter family protein [Bacilli bacterium]
MNVYLILASILFLLGLPPLFSLLFEGGDFGARRVARVGVMLALALVLGYMESFLPELFLPGMRLGLANVAILMILYVYGFKEGLFVAVLKAVLVSMLRGNFLAMGGWMAFAGTLLSFLGMALLHFLFKRASIFAVSIFGALLHVSAQVAVSYLYLGQGVWGYLPYLALFSFASGAAVALLCSLLLRHKALLSYLKA